MAETERGMCNLERGRKAVTRMMFHSLRRTGFRAAPLFALMSGLLLLLLSRTTLAQDQATIEKLVQLNKKAMDDYDTADFDASKKSLLDAEKIGKRAGLESHPILARTYIHLGALYLIGFKDNKKAQHYFGKALDIQADIRLDKNLTSSALKDLFASVKAQKGDAGGDEPPPPPPPKKGRARPEPVAVEPDADSGAETPSPRRRAPKRETGGEPDLPTTITALECPYPDDTPPGKKVILRCAADPKLNVAKVVLYYKGHEMSDFEPMTMTKSAKGWFQATVPKKRLDGKSLQFYFEGMDDGDKPVVSNGRAESPNVMLIVERGNKVAGSGEGEGEEEENPLEERSRQTPRLLLGKYDKSQIGVDSRYGNRRFWIGLGAGTGFVYAINGVPEARVHNLMDQKPDVKITGVGWAGLGQLVPEIGVQINPNWAISVEGRHQWIPQVSTAAKYTASGAHAVLLRVIRYTQQDRMRAFFAAAGGGGEGVRMNIQTDFPANPKLKDTVLVGPVLIGGSVGLSFEISKKLTWIAEANALFGMAKQGAVFDFNTALQVNFGDTSGAAEAAAAKKVDSVSGSIDDEEPK